MTDEELLSLLRAAERIDTPARPIGHDITQARSVRDAIAGLERVAAAIDVAAQDGEHFGTLSLELGLRHLVQPFFQHN